MGLNSRVPVPRTLPRIHHAGVLGNRRDWTRRLFTILVVPRPNPRDNLSPLFTPIPGDSLPRSFLEWQNKATLNFLQGLEIVSEYFSLDFAGAQVELSQYLQAKNVIFKTARTGCEVLQLLRRLNSTIDHVYCESDPSPGTDPNVLTQVFVKSIEGHGQAIREGYMAYIPTIWVILVDSNQ